MADAFSRAWSLVKDEGDTEPDVAFHRSNPSFRSPHFTENLSATNPDTWKCDHCGTVRDSGRHEGPYTLDNQHEYQGEKGATYCSKRCLFGEKPYCATRSPGEGHGIHLCDWEIEEVTNHKDTSTGLGHYVSLSCSECENTLHGWADGEMLE